MNCSASKNMKMPLRVLQIEDDALIAKVVAQALRRNTVGTYDIHQVGTHAEGFAYAREKPVDVVLLDLCLPDSRGADGVKHVRKAIPNTPIVVLSTDDEVETRRACYSHGANAFLSKAQLDDIALEACLQAVVRHRISPDIQTQDTASVT